MKKQLENRLQELKSEFEVGKEMLEQLNSQEDELRQKMLRIGGAIQILKEILEEVKPKKDLESDSDNNSDNKSRQEPNLIKCQNLKTVGA